MIEVVSSLLNGGFSVKNMINKSFENLAQRSIYYFIATYPSFYPVISSDADLEEQKSAYEFIKGIYEKLYSEPALLGLKAKADDSFGDWETQKEKPTLAPAIRGNIKKIEEFIALLWKISMTGIAEENSLILNKTEVELKPSSIKQLEAIGVKVSKNVDIYSLQLPCSSKGLKLLGEISLQNVKPAKDDKQKPYLLFSRGVFDVSAPWSKEVFGNMFEDRKVFDMLIEYLDQTGYLRIDNKEYNNQISLDYIKCYGKPEDELKWAWGERTHGGIEVIYEEIKQNQPLISLRVPYFGELLKYSDKMSPQLKEFVISTSKKCDGCRYCVQTDKTGKRPFAFISIDKHNLCPLYAGFQYRWKALKDNTVKGMIEMLRFIDMIFADRRR